MNATDEYYDNKYDDVLSQEFDSVPVRDLINFAESWDLPSNITHVVRTYRKHRVEERVFKSMSKAERYIDQQLEAGYASTVYDQQEMNTYELS